MKVGKEHPEFEAGDDVVVLECRSNIVGVCPVIAPVIRQRRKSSLLISQFSVPYINKTPMISYAPTSSGALTKTISLAYSCQDYRSAPFHSPKPEIFNRFEYAIPVNKGVLPPRY